MQMPSSFILVLFKVMLFTVAASAQQHKPVGSKTHSHFHLYVVLVGPQLDDKIQECLTGWRVWHAGYFPTHTLTEDYALGMEMRRKGWRGMYVEDELVRGSAPDKVRAAFGQRSRWCKVHPLLLFTHTLTVYLYTYSLYVFAHNQCLLSHTYTLSNFTYTHAHCLPSHTLIVYLHTHTHSLSAFRHTHCLS